ncbi:Cyclin_fold protein [Hexamita inflata]|uniref:Cyclin fold protein n=1 Tax=Hexamita inflata TaxID=28002 RepID=A0AA86UAZ0_9EUKA|nr:Cyclin fold protein [Hexamita inflata]CAI9950574.1 Cyclin fold protein [Hexamita inflata]
MNRTQIDPNKLDFAVIYIKRLIADNKIIFDETNWYRIVMIALVVASKMIDDIVLATYDYILCIRGMNKELLYELEKEFIELLQFNLFVDMLQIESINQPSVNQEVQCILDFRMVGIK